MRSKGTHIIWANVAPARLQGALRTGKEESELGKSFNLLGPLAVEFVLPAR